MVERVWQPAPPRRPPDAQDLPDPDWIARPQVRESLRAVAGLGLRLEVLSRAEHLPSVCDVLAATPSCPR